MQVPLPKEEVQEYRAIDAEMRALRAETNLALQNMARRQEEIRNNWKGIAGGSLEG